MRDPAEDVLILTEFTAQDIDWLIQQINSPRLLFQWSGNRFRYPLTRFQLENHLRNANHPAVPRSHLFKAYHRERNSIVGYGEIASIQSRNRAAFLSRILITQNFRNSGLGELLVRNLLKIGFEKYNLNRIELNVFSFNHAAIQCYKRAGFVVEGTMRESCFDGTAFENEVRMSILQKEWQNQTR